MIVIVNVISSSISLYTLKLELIFPSETSVLLRPTRRHISEDSVLPSIDEFLN
jgi:hypothetical protein